MPLVFIIEIWLISYRKLESVKKIFSKNIISNLITSSLNLAFKKFLIKQTKIINKEKLHSEIIPQAIMSLIIYKPINLSQIIKGKVCQTS